MLIRCWTKSVCKFSETEMSWHCNDVIMGAIASQITSLTIVYSTVYSGADQRKHRSSASLAFVWGIHRDPVNSPHKWPVTRKMFPFDDVIMMLTTGASASVLPRRLSDFQRVQIILNRIISGAQDFASSYDKTSYLISERPQGLFQFKRMR